jgi:predicted O-methyltransferase YrrM
MARIVGAAFGAIRRTPPNTEIPTHLTDKELTLLYRLTARLPRNGTIVEIGSYLGASATVLAAGARRSGARVYCVDTWENEGMTEGERDTWPEFRENTKRDSDVIVPLRGRSEDIAPIFQGSIDFLFIDGDHSWEGIQRDLRTWGPKLKHSAWLLLHDIGWAEGVQKAVAEIVRPWEVEAPSNLPNLYACRVDPSKSSAPSAKLS